MPPSNSLDTVNWMGMVKLPAKTTANASFSMGANHQDEALIPWTTNSSINTAGDRTRRSPSCAELPRDTAQMRVNYTTGTMNVSSRAIKDVTLTARYRFNSRNDFTHEFDAVEYVRFDAVPEETGGATEPFNINRNTLDLSAAYTGISHSTIRAGYVYDLYEHGVRATQGCKDNTARHLVRPGRQPVRHAARRCTSTPSASTIGFNDEDGHRRWRCSRPRASTTRRRASATATTLIVEVTPVSTVGLNFTLFNGKDDYAGRGRGAGVRAARQQEHRLDGGRQLRAEREGQRRRRLRPRDLQRASSSRATRTRRPTRRWTDPNRNWTMTHDEKVNTFTAYLNLIKAFAKTDIRASYDLMDSDQSYVHGGPRIAALRFRRRRRRAARSSAFPNVTDKWQRATIDLTYSVSKKLGLGASYWYEKFDVRGLRDDQHGRAADAAAAGARRADRDRRASTGSAASTPATPSARTRGRPSSCGCSTTSRSDPTRFAPMARAPRGARAVSFSLATKPSPDASCGD